MTFKKALIISCILVLLVSAVYGGALLNATKPGAAPANTTAGQQNSGETKSDLKPADITVGVYDPGAEPSFLTQTLISRLTQLGFQASAVKTADAKQLDQELMTVMYTTGKDAAVDTLKRAALTSSVVRELPTDGQTTDLVIVAWSVDDVAWGDLKDKIADIENPNPSSVTVLILNAGAPSGEAGRVASLLSQIGYTEAKAESASFEVKGPVIVYYQRNYRTFAKKLAGVLRSNGFSDATFQARQAQQDPVVVTLPLPVTPAE